ncbi:MAG: sugar phosphate isomerase/epimerase [Acholeplasmatales bacterium]|nr:sugar phosphate isomerase/epimerase [Acholeplasmatales bacterium]
MKKLLMIPRINELEENLKLRDKLNIGFEYNDFFIPDLLDDEKALKERVNAYKKVGGFNTIHGVFFDICFNSSDKLIKDASYKRARQTLDIAKELGCKKIVFHTNYIIGFNSNDYKKMWVERNALAYKEFLKEYQDIEILIENMFDNNDILIRELLDMVNDKRFRMCLDIAHANLSDESISEWIKNCKKYVSHIHINDNFKDVDSHLAIGDGNMDYDYIISELNKMDDISILIEVKNTPDFIKSYDYLISRGLKL